jgi:chaperone required for assembly of F1-ATPase
MTSSNATPKRFYKAATVEPQGDGWTIALDGRTIKTPTRGALTLPREALAQALAAEWNAQGERIDLTAMYLMRLANIAIDHAPDARDGMADEVARFCETDLICHIAEEPEDLIALDAAGRLASRDHLGRGLVIGGAGGREADDRVTEEAGTDRH